MLLLVWMYIFTDISQTYFIVIILYAVLQVYYGHSNYVYGLALLPGGGVDSPVSFVSVSEDRSLRVWRNGESVQTITHPSTSVWSVCVLDDGDIVTGSR